jgi:RNA polymerase sigma-70 factor (ECF subfamily)
MPETGIQSKFVTTRWTKVQAAGRAENAKMAREAREYLCKTYRSPVYCYMRRWGHKPHEAEDLTQDFFTRLIKRDWNLVKRANQGRGRFRTFLLTAVSRFLKDEWKRRQAKKRGGGVTILPLQSDTTETRYGVQPAENCTPEQIYEKKWADTILATALSRLRSEYNRRGNAELFDTLKPCLEGGSKTDQPYEKLGKMLGRPVDTIKSDVRRLRERLRSAVEATVGDTVSDPKEVEDELRYLRVVLSR